MELSGDKYVLAAETKITKRENTERRKSGGHRIMTALAREEECALECVKRYQGIRGERDNKYLCFPTELGDTPKSGSGEISCL